MMPGENKRHTGARKSVAHPEMDLERRPEGGPKVDTPEEMARKKPYGFTEPVSDVPAETRHSNGVNPPNSSAADREPNPPQEVRPREMLGRIRT
jgi:hypothetical protein